MYEDKEAGITKEILVSSILNDLARADERMSKLTERQYNLARELLDYTAGIALNDTNTQMFIVQSLDKNSPDHLTSKEIIHRISVRMVKCMCLAMKAVLEEGE